MIDRLAGPRIASEDEARQGRIRAHLEPYSPGAYEAGFRTLVEQLLEPEPALR